MDKTVFTRSDIARLTGVAVPSVHKWTWLRPRRRKKGGPPTYDEEAVAAALVYSELTGGGMEPEEAREIARVLQSGDSEQLDTWFIGARKTAPGIMTVLVEKDVTPKGREELAALKQKGVLLDYASLRELRDAMVERVRMHPKGSRRLLHPEGEGA